MPMKIQIMCILKPFLYTQFIWQTNISGFFCFHNNSKDCAALAQICVLQEMSCWNMNVIKLIQDRSCSSEIIEAVPINKLNLF